jgi:hypothetical protein
VLRSALLAALVACSCNAAPQLLPPSHASVRVLARTLESEPGTLQWSWSGSGAMVAFRGTSCAVHLQARGGLFRVLVDGVEKAPLDLQNNNDTLHVLASGLTNGDHVVEIRQKTEAQNCTSRFRGFRIEGTPVALPPASERRIEFYGNSISCGYGILDSSENNPFQVSTEDEGKTFAALAADALGAERRVVCWSGKGMVQNYGRDTVNPTLPKFYQQILPWDTRNLWNFSRWTPQLVVVEIGTNDYSTVAPDPARFVKTYEAFLDSLHARYPQARFVLVDGPMMSDNYPAGMNALTAVRRNIASVIASVSARGIVATQLSLTPQGSLGYGADWHPSRAQAILNGQELTAHLRTAMGWTGSSVMVPAGKATRAELLRNGSEVSVRIPQGPAVRARVLDARGRSLWSAKLQGGSTTPIPHDASWTVLEVTSPKGVDSFPLPQP